MNKTYTSVATSIIFYALASNHVWADNNRHTGFANVTHVAPIYKTIKQSVPQERCWVETVREKHQPHHSNSTTSTIIGGVIGAVIGSEVGHSRNNKRIGAVAGSLLGMSIANDIAYANRSHASQNNHVSYRDITRCEVTEHIETKRITDGYNVSYNYQGGSYTTRMDTHPGKRIKVMVNVQPFK